MDVLSEGTNVPNSITSPPFTLGQVILHWLKPSFMSFGGQIISLISTAPRTNTFSTSKRNQGHSALSGVPPVFDERDVAPKCCVSYLAKWKFSRIGRNR